MNREDRQVHLNQILLLELEVLVEVNQTKKWFTYTKLEQKLYHWLFYNNFLTCWTSIHMYNIHIHCIWHICRIHPPLSVVFLLLGIYICLTGTLSFAKDLKILKITPPIINQIFFSFLELKVFWPKFRAYGCNKKKN